MKKHLIILLILVLISFTNTKAQSITLEQLISLRTKSVANVEEFLTTNNWQYIKGEDEGLNMAQLVFAYRKNTYNDNAQSFITYYYTSYLPKNNIVRLQTANSNIYKTLLNRIKLLGYKLHNSTIESGEIVKKYIGKGISIKVSISTVNQDEATSTMYVFLIERNSEDLSSKKSISTLHIDNVIDPVCEMSASSGMLTNTIKFKGKVIGFCSEECKNIFLKNPDDYIQKIELNHN